MTDAGAPAVPALELTLPARGLPPDQLWELMWRRRLQTAWLGESAAVAHEADCRLTFGDVAGAWRGGRVRAAKDRRRELTLQPAAGWSPGSRTAVSIAAEEDENGLGRVRIVESGFAGDEEREEARIYWEGALARLRGMIAEVGARRDRPRQAIVLIHGIGEQRPGRTLRDFVAAGVIPAGTAGPWVRPDRISGSFELRTVTFRARGREMPTTDVYELYWAHVIRDTTLSHVVGWARGLLLRRRVPPALRPAWVAGWVVAALVVAAIVVQALVTTRLVPWLATAVAVIVVLGLVWRLAGKGLAINFLGDAARYLSPRPANIAHRQAVRQAGVDLLERLHDDGRYDRIVLLGHSLGSVIAYDVLTHAWIRMSHRHRRPRAPSFAEVRAVERAIGTVADHDEAQALQHAAWRRQRCNTQPWLVTDLVTVGSPLAYVDFLVTSGPGELERAVADRVMPSCPPATETEKGSGHRRCSYERDYRVDMGSGSATFTAFHHGAPFAVTRWTNLFFRPRRLGMVGDPVGGPIASQLGRWVKDVPLDPPALRFTHTWYWRPVRGRMEHIDALRQAIAPGAGADLISLAGEAPAFAVAERTLDD